MYRFEQSDADPLKIFLNFTMLINFNPRFNKTLGLG